MERIKSIGQPELATMSALVETTERKRDKELSSPVNFVVGSQLRHANTRHRQPFFKKRCDMNLNVPKSTNGIEKHCWAVIHSADEAMLENSLKRKADYLRTDYVSEGVI